MPASGNCRRGARPFLETLALCARPVAPELVFEASGRRQRRTARSRRFSAPRASSAAAVRRSGSSRITIGFARRWPRSCPPKACVGFTADSPEALVARQIDDPEALFEHCRGAGDHAAAADHAMRGRAEGDGRARVRSGGVAVSAGAGSDRRLARRHRRGRWRSADALAHAGRPAEAAEAVRAGGGRIRTGRSAWSCSGAAPSSS